MSKTHRQDEYVWSELSNAIVICAIRDWCYATRALRTGKVASYNNIKKKKEVEEFFNSEWCEFLSGIEGDQILQMLKKEKVDDIIARITRLQYHREDYAKIYSYI